MVSGELRCRFRRGLLRITDKIFTHQTFGSEDEESMDSVRISLVFDVHVLVTFKSSVHSASLLDQ